MCVRLLDHMALGIGSGVLDPSLHILPHCAGVQSTSKATASSCVRSEANVAEATSVAAAVSTAQAALKQGATGNVLETIASVRSGNKAHRDFFKKLSGKMGLAVRKCAVPLQLRRPHGEIVWVDHPVLRLRDLAKTLLRIGLNLSIWNPSSVSLGAISGLRGVPKNGRATMM